MLLSSSHHILYALKADIAVGNSVVCEPIIVLIVHTNIVIVIINIVANRQFVSLVSVISLFLILFEASSDYFFRFLR